MLKSRTYVLEKRRIKVYNLINKYLLIVYNILIII
nr:MAG TPA: hypothetical protein [Caudoviricetes sp.]